MWKHAPARLALLISLLLSGCGLQPEATGASRPSIELNVFAAASLTDAFTEIGVLYEKTHPGTKVVFNFAGSQQLAQQINEGAPADVFASASKKQMDMVIEAGGIVSGAPQVFARNQLVVVLPQENPAGLKELRELARPRLKLVLAAREVPVGQYALDFLDRAAADPALGAAYKDAVLANVVSYENNVKAVLAKVALGEADAGIVYRSDAAGDHAGGVGQLAIPDALNVIATYPVAPLAATKRPDEARAFIDLLVAPAGQAILAKYGFIPATEEAGER